MNKRITLTLVLIMNLAWVLAQTSGTFGRSHGAMPTSN